MSSSDTQWNGDQVWCSIFGCFVLKAFGIQSLLGILIAMLLSVFVHPSREFILLAGGALFWIFRSSFGFGVRMYVVKSTHVLVKQCPLSLPLSCPKESRKKKPLFSVKFDYLCWLHVLLKKQKDSRQRISN